MCCIPWGCKESDTTEWLNWTDFIINIFQIFHGIYLTLMFFVAAIDWNFKFNCASYILSGNPALAAFGSSRALELGRRGRKEKNVLCNWAQDTKSFPLDWFSWVLLCCLEWQELKWGPSRGAHAYSGGSVGDRLMLSSLTYETVFLFDLFWVPSAPISGRKPHSIKGRSASSLHKQKSKDIWEPGSPFGWHLISLSGFLETPVT